MKSKISACIFDLNGTVLSDEDEYEIAFAKVLETLGVELSGKRPFHVKGIGVKENWPVLLKKYKIKTDKTADELALLTQIEYINLLPRVTLTDGFELFAGMLIKSGIKTALATSNDYSVVEKVFEVLPIGKYFEVVTSKEEIVRNKPDPEIFLITAEKLLVEPSECMVFEDSKAGISAAKQAGMKAVGIKSAMTTEDEFLEADLIIPDFTGTNILQTD